MKPSRREGFSLKSDKLLFAFGNYITAVFGNFNNILNTHAESSFKINARFYAEYHSGFGDNVAKRRKTRIFMNFKSKAVTKTVTELAFITRFVNPVAGNGVNAVAGNSGAHGVNGRGLCLINKVIYLFLFISEQYPLCAAPKSIVTKSPSFTLLRPGTAWGIEPFAPAARIVSKARPVAPFLSIK